MPNKGAPPPQNINHKLELLQRRHFIKVKCASLLTKSIE